MKTIIARRMYVPNETCRTRGEEVPHQYTPTLQQCKGPNFLRFLVRDKGGIEKIAVAFIDLQHVVGCTYQVHATTCSNQPTILDVGRVPLCLKLRTLRHL